MIETGCSVWFAGRSGDGGSDGPWDRAGGSSWEEIRRWEECGRWAVGTGASLGSAIRAARWCSSGGLVGQDDCCGHGLNDIGIYDDRDLVEASAAGACKKVF